jgi:outer membrane protein assembly factor BamA
MLHTGIHYSLNLLRHGGPLWICFVAAIFACRAQETTRAAQIEQQQQEKAQQLTPETAGRVEQKFVSAQNVQRWLQTGVKGFRIKFGALVSGSGLAAGPQYSRPDLAKDNIAFRVLGQLSTHKYQLYDADLLFPRLLNDKAFAGVSGTYLNYPQVNFYGIGPNSRKDGRSNYLLEKTSVDVSAGVRPLPHLRISGRGEYARFNVGPGRDSRFADAAVSYPDVPGMLQQTNFLIAGPVVEVDYRDRPGAPAKGGYYTAEYLLYDDQKLGLHQFRRLNAEVQQYFPFLNRTHVLVLRGRTELTYPGSNQLIPFYVQPNLGGGDDLRGFRPFRFYDNNSIVYSAEYRWSVSSGLDMALFGDAGKVFPTHSQLNFAHLRTDAGLGFRLKGRDAVFMRLDVALSNEGFQIWLKFRNAFSYCQHCRW